MDEAVLERLPRFSWADLKKNLAGGTPFEAISPLGTVLLRIRAYEPIVGLAVHAGHRVREELVPKMALEEPDRRSEEDVGADEFVADMPIQMIGLDSRFEYDLNRPRDQAVYLKPFQSWGKKVWMNPPTKDELAISYQKYDEFHDLLDFLVGEMVTRCEKILLLDMHSYSPQRSTFVGRSSPLPVFSLGTSLIDRKKHAKVTDYVLGELAKAELPGVAPTTKENDPFKGDGAVVKNLVAKYPDTPVLSIEVKKVYLDDASGELNGDLTGRLKAFFGNLARKGVKQIT